MLDLLPEHYSAKRLFPVGRLDYFSEGLLLLTDDGELANQLTHPRHHLPKYYEVVLRGELSPQGKELMEKGMRLAEGEKLAPVRVERLGLEARNEKLLLTLYQGINRQIRRMFRDLDMTILSLKRIGQGPLKLGALRKGECRELSLAELKELREALALRAD